jgi:hypothetical protein
VTVPAALAAALCLAGCGSPKAAKPGFFDLDSTTRCLQDAGLTVRKNPADLDLVSSTAPDGALRSAQTGTAFVVAFGDSERDAELLVEGYRRSASTPHARKRLGSLLDREGNAVVYWQKEPTPAQAASVRACLK